MCYSREHKREFEDVKFAPWANQYGGERFEVEKVVYHLGYKNDPNEVSLFDYALLFLKDSLKEKFCGRLKVNYEKNNCENKKMIEVAGYPNLPSSKKTMYRGTGQIKSSDENFIKHLVSTN